MMSKACKKKRRVMSKVLFADQQDYRVAMPKIQIMRRRVTLLLPKHKITTSQSTKILRASKRRTRVKILLPGLTTTLSWVKASKFKMCKKRNRVKFRELRHRIKKSKIRWPLNTITATCHKVQAGLEYPITLKNRWWMRSTKKILLLKITKEGQTTSNCSERPEQAT